jgi:hypothetical protein
MYPNAHRITLAQAEMLCAETRQALGLPPPIAIIGMRSYARAVPAASSGPSAPPPKTYADLTFLARARLKQQNPVEYAKLRAHHDGRIEGLQAKLGSSKTRAEYVAAHKELLKLKGLG